MTTLFILSLFLKQISLMISKKIFIADTWNFSTLFVVACHMSGSTYREINSLCETTRETWNFFLTALFKFQESTSLLKINNGRWIMREYVVTTSNIWNMCTRISSIRLCPHRFVHEAGKKSKIMVSNLLNKLPI